MRIQFVYLHLHGVVLFAIIIIEIESDINRVTSDGVFGMIWLDFQLWVNGEQLLPIRERETFERVELCGKTCCDASVGLWICYAANEIVRAGGKNGIHSY